MREKSHFACSECGYVSTRWLGRCPQCGSWGTLVERAGDRKPSPGVERQASPVQVNPVSQVASFEEERLSSGIPEFDRVLGGGIVPGSVVLIGGEPGVGKSTLLLQVSANVARQERAVLYMSGEESGPQIRSRAERLGAVAEGLFLLCDSDVTAVEEATPDGVGLIIVDSVQAVGNPELPSPVGSVTQVREVASFLIRLAKRTGVPVLITGHVTKEGVLAGPKLLEHVVDAVLYFEGEQAYNLRLLRAVKNRFGSTNELGVFEMTEKGLVGVANPSAFFLERRERPVPGTAVVPVLQGTRPLMVEVQALCAPTHFAAPRRVVAGLDYNRILLILAVLEKRAGVKLGNKDVYVSVAGGIRVEEPAADLAVAVAVSSSIKDTPLRPDTVMLGEVGLAGDVRGVHAVEARLREALQMGFKRGILPLSAARSLKGSVKGIEPIPVGSIKEAIEEALR